MKACPTCGEVMVLTRNSTGGFWYCPIQAICSQKTISDIPVKGPRKPTKKEDRPFAWVDDLGPIGDPMAVTYDPPLTCLGDSELITGQSIVSDDYALYDNWAKDLTNECTGDKLDCHKHDSPQRILLEKVIEKLEKAPFPELTYVGKGYSKAALIEDLRSVAEGVH